MIKLKQKLAVSSSTNSDQVPTHGKCIHALPHA